MISSAFGIPSGAPAAAPAAAQQAAITAQQNQTDANIATGANTINADFAQFTPAYYQGVANAYTAAEDPQLKDQFHIAKGQLTAQLAGAGQLGGSAGNEAQAQLQKTYAENEASVAAGGQSAAQQMESTVSNDETNLYGMNATAANPNTTATMAQATSGALVAPQAYPTLSNVFASALSPLSNATKSATTGLYGPYTPTTQQTTPTTGSGSASYS